MAMAAAIFPSVTVSMGELTIGVRRVMFFVILEERSTWKPKASSEA
jgi:hypothetical protein